VSIRQADSHGIAERENILCIKRLSSSRGHRTKPLVWKKERSEEKARNSSFRRSITVGKRKRKDGGERAVRETTDDKLQGEK